MNKVSKNLINDVVSNSLDGVSLSIKRYVKMFILYDIDYILSSIGYAIGNNGSDCLFFNKKVALNNNITTFTYLLETKDVLQISKNVLEDGNEFVISWNDKFNINIVCNDLNIINRISYNGIDIIYTYDYNDLEVQSYYDQSMVYHAVLSPSGTFKNGKNRYAYSQIIPPVPSLIKTKSCSLSSFDEAIKYLNDKSLKFIGSR